jgi:hypothetical protein
MMKTNNTSSTYVVVQKKISCAIPILIILSFIILIFFHLDVVDFENRERI